MCGTGGGFNPNACTPHSNSLARGSHSKPHALQCIAAQDGTWHRGTPGRGQVTVSHPHPETGTLTQEWMPHPPGVGDALGGGPLPPHGGRLGTDPASQAVPSGRASLHPDLWLPCRHSACILGLQMSMCCPHVSRTPPSPGTRLLRGGPLLLPRLPVSPRPTPGVICGQGYHFCAILFFTRK